MERYCSICEKMVETKYLLNYGNRKMFKGVCGHTSPVVDVEKKSTPGIIINCSDMGAGGISRI